MEKLVSIIVPVYNVQNFLQQSIQSILQQTYDNLEIMLIDDGSTDSSGTLCDEFASRDSRIRVIHKSNGGQGSARNKGLDVCTGEYILFLDSDDYLELDCVEKLYKMIESKAVDIAVCNYRFVDENGVSHGLFTELEGYLEFSGYEVLKHMWNDEIINIAPWAKLYKKELWTNFRFKECYCEDSATMYLLYKENMKIGYLSNPLVNYMLRTNSDVRSFSEKKLIMLDIYETVVSYSKEHFPQYLVKAAVSKEVAVNFHVLFQLSTEHINVRERIYKKIRMYRRTVLFDRTARRKTRLACWLSYMGFDLTEKVFRIIKKNKPAF